MTKNNILKFALYAFAAAAVAYALVAGSSDHKDGTFLIDGQEATVGKGGLGYFGEKLEVDLDGDDRDDVVFIVTDERGGSGTFYYVVAALNTKDGYVGSDGYLLGDRVAPQGLELSPNPRHVDVVVANYADRAPGEPMTARPSVGKSAYLKLDLASMRWGIVEPDFEGEAR